MKRLLPVIFLLSSGAAPPQDHPKTYLLSVVNLPLRADEQIESFRFATWGAYFKAVCRIPPGWRIKAGTSATPDGELSGQGSQGATWFKRSSPPEIRNFVLVTLYGPVQANDIRQHDGVIPSTFNGTAVILTDAGERKARLGSKNIALVPADQCP